MVFDPIVFKAQFPLFQQAENKQLVYFDNAATSQRPQAVINAISDFYLHHNANTHRSSHRLARQATLLLEQARQKTADFLGAKKPSQIVFTSGATAALNLLAHSLCSELNPDDEILLTRSEHHANLVPWQMQAKLKALQLRFIDDEKGELTYSTLAQHINDKTRIVSVTAASNILGQTTDIAAIKNAIGSRDIRFIVDGSQIVAHHSLSLDNWPCDFFVCSAHKFYGPTGVGILYAKENLLDTLTPWQGGGEMIRSVGLIESTYNTAPQRFEAGTASLAAIAGLAACVDFLNTQDRPAIEAYEKELIQYLHQKLISLPFIHLLTKTENNVGLATFMPKKDWPIQSADIAHFLDEADIAVRAGQLCAEPLVNVLEASSVVRVSLAAYNTYADIDRLITALEDCYSASHINQTAVTDDLKGLNIEQLLQQKNYQQRYKMLMLWSDLICAKPAIHQAQFLVSGCESNVWLDVKKNHGRYHFLVDSDSRFIKGLAALLLVAIQDKTAEEINAFNAKGLFSELGFDKHLSASRQNGFYALLQAMQQQLSS